MRIQKIDNINFEAKKFRVPVTVERFERGNNNLVKVRTVSGNWVDEYPNPDARELFNRAQKTNDIHEQIRLIRQMGHPELKNLSLSSRINEWYNKNVLKRILKDEW